MPTNSNGYVAVKHYQFIHKRVQINGRTYDFIPRHGVSMAWVHPDDVGKLLELRGGCNCPNNTSGKSFRLANDLDVSYWETGSRP